MKSVPFNLGRNQFWLVTLVLLSACGPLGPQRVLTEQWSVQQAIRYQEILVDLTSPVMEGRGAGTAGLDLARDYIANDFKRLGLAPAFDYDVNPSFSQPFEINLGPEVHSQALILEDSSVLESGREFNAVGISASGLFEGQAIFAGYGIESKRHTYNSYESLAPEDIDGKIVVAYRFEPQDSTGHSLWSQRDGYGIGRWSRQATFYRKAETAARHGASALLVVNPPSLDSGSKLVSVARSGGLAASIPVIHITSNVFERMLASCTQMSPDIFSKRLQKQADHGTTPVLSLGRIRGHVEIERQQATVSNVAAILTGSGELADEVVVVGAHYDHLGYGGIGSRVHVAQMHPGADDNASGAGALMLLAEMLRAELDHATRRTVLFVAFAGEERGLLGSAYLTKHLGQLGVNAKQIVAMINMDMIGRLENNRLFVFGTDSGDQWNQLLGNANQSIGLDLHTAGSAQGASDHVHFYNQKIPVLHFFTGAHADYHRPSDTVEKINQVGSMRVLSLVKSLVIELVIQRQRLAFKHDNSIEMRRPTAPSYGAGYLGIMPDYETLHGESGCGVQAVTINGPAHQAGLRENDVIVRWGKNAIGNVYDLTRQLRSSEIGSQVELRVLRSGKPIQLMVKIGSRSK